MNDDDDTQEYAHQRQWVGLTHEDMMLLVEQARKTPAKGPCPDYNERLLTLANNKLKEKNHDLHRATAQPY
jgi:hypothetical protein